MGQMHTQAPTVQSVAGLLCLWQLELEAHNEQQKSTGKARNLYNQNENSLCIYMYCITKYITFYPTTVYGVLSISEYVQYT